MTKGLSFQKFSLLRLLLLAIGAAFLSNNFNMDMDFTSTEVSTVERPKVALCAIVKDADEFIAEWVNYNLALGFEHIYLYDNSDDFVLEAWARNMNKQGHRLMVTHQPGKVQQIASYNNCVKYIARNRQDITFAAFFDADEFLNMKKHVHVADLIKEHCPTNCTALTFNWHLFGAKHAEKASIPLPLTKRFQYYVLDPRRHVKSVARIDAYKGFSTPHCVVVKYGDIFDTNGSSNKCPFHHDGPTDIAVLHHYYEKSLTEFNRRCVRGRATKDMKGKCHIPLRNYNVSYSSFDSSAWEFLKKHYPEYSVYDRPKLLTNLGFEDA